MSLTQINKAGLDEIALDHVFTIGAYSTSAYTFQGEGLNGTVNNPTLYLTRGKTYRFENGSGGHPIRIQSTSGANDTAYNTGVTNNAGGGTVIVEVQHDAPDVLYYQCTSHAAMNGILYITGALADGGVTTAKIASTAVTEAKIASSAVTEAKIANNAVTTNKIATSAVTTNRIADDAVTTAKIAAGAITNSEISSNAIGPGTIAANAVTTAKIADDAVTNAKIADGAVGSNQLGGNAVTAAKIGANEVTSAAIAAGAVGSAKIADQAVTLDKLPHGTGSNDGKFLRANNGADPTFESVPAGITLNSNAANVLIQGSSTANTIQGNSNFKTSGGYLHINDDNGGISIGTAGAGSFGTTPTIGRAQQSGYHMSTSEAGDLCIGGEHTNSVVIGTTGSSSGGLYGRFKVNGSGQITTPHNPAFAIRNSTNADFTWSNATNFPFNSAVFNRGSHFSTSNYRFTAPVDGAYQFQFYCIIRGNDHHRTPSFTVNGNNRHIILTSFSWQSGTNYYDYMGFSIVRLLSANDYVAVYNLSGKDITTHGHEYSLFSGFLIG